MKEMDRDKLNTIFKFSYDRIHKLSNDELYQLFTNDKQKYSEFATDIVMFYCSRFYLSNGTITIPKVELA